MTQKNEKKPLAFQMAEVVGTKIARTIGALLSLMGCLWSHACGALQRTAATLRSIVAGLPHRRPELGLHASSMTGRELQSGFGSHHAEGPVAPAGASPAAPLQRSCGTDSGTTAEAGAASLRNADSCDGLPRFRRRLGRQTAAKRTSALFRNKRSLIEKKIVTLHFGKLCAAN